MPTRQRAYRVTQSGVTLLEMMVAVALLTVIMLGLTAMFLQTQKAFKGGLKQTDISEGARSAMSLITRDLQQMSDAQLPDITNFVAQLNLQPPFVQKQSIGGAVRVKTNFLQDVYSLARVGSKWVATGYTVYSPAVNSEVMPGVGTLYRYCVTTNISRPGTNLFYDFYNASISNPNFHRVADGVVRFQIRAFDKDGIEMLDIFRSQPPGFPIVTNTTILTNLPSYLEIELAILEPETLAQAQSLGSSNNAANFLSTRMNHVHVYRQQVPIRTAPIR